MCHESSGVALTQTIGIGKGSVTLDDIHEAELIVVVGQNPGTNHPRMRSALELAKGNGASVVAVNPLPEAGLTRFKNPQRAKGIVGKGTQGAADAGCVYGTDVEPAGGAIEAIELPADIEKTATYGAGVVKATDSNSP